MNMISFIKQMRTYIKKKQAHETNDPDRRTT